MAYAITMTTCADKEDAEALARSIVAKRLAGCVQVVKIRSYYEWEGEPRRDKERLLLVKGSKEKLAELKAHILAEHKYGLPEIVSVDIADGHEPYLRWLSSEGGSPSANGN